MIYDVEDIKKQLKKRLSQKRYHHTLCVADEAKKLAYLNGFDEDKAYTAGLLHDLAKEVQAEEQLDIISRWEGYIDPVEKENKAFYHAVAGAVLAREMFSVRDPDILNAVRYHTMARAGMTELEKIVFLADAVSRDRDYSDVKHYRRICRKNLDKGMLEVLRFQIQDNLKKTYTVAASTVEAYNDYAKKEKLNDGGK